MMASITLLEDLLKQTTELPHRGDAALDSLTRRAQMLIRRIYGESSPYLADLNKIYFRPRFAPSSEEDKNGRWSTGQQQLIHLINTMLEEQQVFESQPTPILTINDAELRERTSDLLSAPGNYDRVLREATTILEARIRDKIPFEDLAKLFPKASDQSGDTLINKLLSPNDPVIVYGDRLKQNQLFRMLGGVVAYLRNPSHHSVDGSVEWSWAWSVVGLIDQLLEDLRAASYSRPADL